jgi:hypothetical protein
MAEIVQLPVAALADALEEEKTLWVRFAADRSENGWLLRLLEITTAEPPPLSRVTSQRGPVPSVAHPTTQVLAPRSVSRTPIAR